MKRVAVFFGGASNEHEISVLTGMMAINLLKSAGYEVLPVFLPLSGGMTLAKNASRAEDVAGESRFPAVQLNGPALERKRGIFRKKQPFDVALNCCHGGMGEDGTLAALLAWAHIPSASPGVPESALFMDKAFTKIAARGLDIPAAPFFTVGEREFAASPDNVFGCAAAFGYPVVVKPARLGSSIGLTVAHGQKELEETLSLAFTLDDKALVERYFEGKRDINCAACRLDGEVRVSACEEVFSAGELLTYAEKYEAGKGAQFPARLPAPLAAQIAGYTRRLYEAFGMRGVVRADFLVVGQEAYFNELNIVPGSLAGYLFGETLSKIRAFFAALLDEALREAPARKQVLKTGILSEGIFSGVKGCKRRGNFV